jgi:micrococcal nuclease
VRRWIVLAPVLALVAVAVAAAVAVTRDGTATEGVVTYVRDGDTIELEDGDVVRLVQIDTPELSDGECYATRARALTLRLLPVGTHVRIEEDARLDQVDRYGRRLAYVLKGEQNVNRLLVARGAAGVWFFDGRRGRYAPELLAAERRAKERGLGLWGRCPDARLDPLSPVDTGSG